VKVILFLLIKGLKGEGAVTSVPNYDARSADRRDCRFGIRGQWVRGHFALRPDGGLPVIRAYA